MAPGLQWSEPIRDHDGVSAVASHHHGDRSGDDRVRSVWCRCSSWTPVAPVRGASIRAVPPSGISGFLTAELANAADAEQAEDVTVTLEATTDCDAASAICTTDGRRLSNAVSATVSGPSNTAATGAPTITGEARVGETLTASTADIEDADGLSGATFAFQWVSVDGGAEDDIAGATGASYVLGDADVGAEIKVRASFTDDAGNGEELASAATARVEPRPRTRRPRAPLPLVAVRRGPARR